MIRRFALTVSLVALIHIGATAGRVSGMGGPLPETLHEILAHSDVVAVARVAAVQAGTFGVYEYTKLKLERVIRGKPHSQEVLVVNSDPNGCSGPAAKFVVKDRVLVFLKYLEEDSGDRYVTSGSSKAVRVLNDAALAATIRRVEEFYRIRMVEHDAKRKLYWAEWAVRCAEEPSSLSDAMDLLSRGTSGELDSDPLPNSRTRYFPLLDESQVVRLLKVIKRPELDQNSCRDKIKLTRVIAFAIQDQLLLDIASEISKFVRSRKKIDSDELFAERYHKLILRYLARCDELELSGT